MLYLPLYTAALTGSPYSTLPSNPWSAISIIAFGSREEYEPELSYLRQHLKTGYYEKVYLPLKELKEKMPEEEFRNYLMVGAPVVGAPEPPEPSEDVITLVKDLSWDINAIISQVEHGVPLQGYCDACPDRVLTIKDAAEKRKRD